MVYTPILTYGCLFAADSSRRSQQRHAVMNTLPANSAGRFDDFATLAPTPTREKVDNAFAASPSSSANPSPQTSAELKAESNHTSVGTPDRIHEPKNWLDR